MREGSLFVSYMRERERERVCVSPLHSLHTGDGRGSVPQRPPAIPPSVPLLSAKPEKGWIGLQRSFKGSSSSRARLPGLHMNENNHESDVHEDLTRGSAYADTPYVLVRSLKAALGKARDHSKLVREASLFAFFALNFTLYVMLGSTVVEQRRMAHTMEQRFVSQPFLNPSKGYLTFDEITNFEDAWIWVEKVLIPKVYDESATFNRNTNAFLGDDHVSIAGANSLLFGIRFRQIRMAAGNNTGCEIPLGIIDAGITDGRTMCVDKYDLSKAIYADRQPFGIPRKVETTRYDGTTTNATLFPYRWVPASDTTEPEYSGRIESYDGSGFIVDLPLNRTKAMDLVAEMAYGRDAKTGHVATKDTADVLRHSQFIDPQVSRALFITFGVYNPGLNMHMSCQFNFEWHPAGYMAPSTEFMGSRFFHTSTWQRVLTTVVNLFLNAQIFYYWLRLLLDFRTGCSRLSAWHVFDLASMTLFTYHVFATVRDLVFNYPATELIAASQAASSGKYYSLSQHMFLAKTERQYIGANMVLCAIRGLRYLQVFSSLRIILRSITSTGQDVTNFFIVLFMTLFSFASGAYFFFSPHISGFKTVGECVLTMISMMDGQVSLMHLQSAFDGIDQRVLIFSFFALSMLLSYLLLLNSMMFGIFIESWTATYAEVIRQEAKVEKRATAQPLWKEKTYAAWAFLKKGPAAWKKALLDAVTPDGDEGLIGMIEGINYEQLAQDLHQWTLHPRHKSAQFLSIVELKEIMKVKTFTRVDEVLNLLIIPWKASTNQPNFFTLEKKSEALDALFQRRQNILHRDAQISTFEERDAGLPLPESSIVSTRKSLDALIALQTKRWSVLETVTKEVYTERKRVSSKLGSLEELVETLAKQVS